MTAHEQETNPRAMQGVGWSMQYEAGSPYVIMTLLGRIFIRNSATKCVAGPFGSVEEANEFLESEAQNDNP